MPGMCLECACNGEYIYLAAVAESRVTVLTVVFSLVEEGAVRGDHNRNIRPE